MKERNRKDRRQKSAGTGHAERAMGVLTGQTGEMVKRCGKEWSEEWGPYRRKGYISPAEESGLYPEGSGKPLP